MGGVRPRTLTHRVVCVRVQELGGARERGHPPVPVPEVSGACDAARTAVAALADVRQAEVDPELGTAVPRRGGRLPGEIDGPDDEPGVRADPEVEVHHHLTGLADDLGEREEVEGRVR